MRYDAAARLIARSKYLIAFTGAGISAESGLPTFRGSGGVWERYNPRSLEIGYFGESPADSWAVIRDLFYASTRVPEPNAAHRVLANWERRGLLSAVVTQNIDNLHTQAGSREVVEYHGNTRELVCLRTGKIYPFDPGLLRELPPRSPDGGILKPNFVFFGEGIAPKAARRAEEHFSQADVVLVIGSTGEVYPAAALPELAARRGATVIEINPEVSAYTHTVTSIHLPDRAAAAMSRLDPLVDELIREQ